MKALKGSTASSLLTKGKKAHMGRGRWHFIRENKVLVAILHLQSNRFMINLHDGISHFKEKATVFREGTPHRTEALTLWNQLHAKAFIYHLAVFKTS